MEPRNINRNHMGDAIKNIIRELTNKSLENMSDDRKKDRDDFLMQCRDMKSVIDWNFNFQKFYSYVCEESLISLELLWNLHVLQIMPFENYMIHIERNDALENLKKNLCVFCFQDSDKSWNRYFVQTGIMSYFISKAFPIDIENEIAEKIQVYLSIIESLLSCMFSFQSNEVSSGNLRAFLTLWTCGALEKESLLSFCLFSFQKYLKHSKANETDAYSVQENCKNKSDPFHLSTVIKKFVTALNFEDLREVLHHAIWNEDTNWKHFTVVIASLLESVKEGSQLLTELITMLINDGFEKLNPKSFQRLLLIGRQVSLNMNLSFASAFGVWFQKNITNSIHTRSPQAVLLLVQVLTDLIPYENNIDCLKIFLERHFSVPHECMTIYSDFITLLKTRVKDLQPRVDTEKIIEKVLSAYKETNKIPPYILEASLMHKHHYLNEFLPALLKPRVLPLKPDLKERFIELLNGSGKIPNSIYLKYKLSCQEEQQKLLAGIDVADDNFEFMDDDIQIID